LEEIIGEFIRGLSTPVAANESQLLQAGVGFEVREQCTGYESRSPMALSLRRLRPDILAMCI
jgi:hypothetical protein